MNITETTLKVEAEATRTTNSGTVFGKIYLACDEDHHYFPELGWTDFVAAILIASLTEISKLRPNQHSFVFFMDGPFELQFSQLDESILKIEATRRGPKEKTLVSTSYVSLRSFLEDLIESARRILAVCDREGWAGLRDIKKLRSLVEQVEKTRRPGSL